ncbi:hypothetical protein BJY24_006572 [Nocardia transvalensis]|uniref:Uncharacterized protein n=1 Tax=Nocardia transvalensis TaxID=37333 RepID=A0A7W9PK75_9NOCA|nr:hypothetical protein [Nocardia transvalensis]MBB5917660.1 hypothetical protein [Nocardia transvalensis]
MRRSAAEACFFDLFAAVDGSQVVGAVANAVGVRDTGLGIRDGVQRIWKSASTATGHCAAQPVSARR